MPAPATAPDPTDTRCRRYGVTVVLFPHVTQLDLTGPAEVFAQVPEFDRQIFGIAGFASPKRSRP